MQLIQMCVQGRWLSDSSLLTLPHFDNSVIAQLNNVLTGQPKELSWQCGVHEIATLPELMIICEHERHFLSSTLKGILRADELKQVTTKLFLNE